MIQSDESAVLTEFKQLTKFKLVYVVDETAISIPDSTIEEIKTFSHAVALRRNVIFPASQFFLVETTNIVQRMHLYNMSVFVFLLRNEFASLAFDYLSDPTMEIRSFVSLAKVDGLITDFPATASAYLGNACLGPRTGTEYQMFLVTPDSLEVIMAPSSMPPALAPAPALSTVSEPPLPPVTDTSGPATASSPANVPATASSPTNVPAAAPHSQPSNADQSRQSLSVSLLIGLFILFFEYN